MDLSDRLTGLPPGVVYLVVALLVGIESLGIPVPGETVLVTAALLAVHASHLSIWWIAVSAVLGAVIGDNIGYLVGRRWGPSLLNAASRRFPRHVSPEHLAYARYLFGRWGVLMVFVGRFVALLRILAGPLAGSLRLSWPKFLGANLAGAICWAGGTTLVVYLAGNAADTYLKKFTWVVLIVVVVVVVIGARAAHRRFEQNVQDYVQAHPDAVEAVG